MNKGEVMRKYNELGVMDTASVLGKKLYQDSNYCHEKVRDDGLVEVVIEGHDGFEDENSREYMRFSFDGNNLLVSMSKNGEPFLDLISTVGLDKDALQKNLEDIIVR